MSKTILITGSTDGIGLETAKMLISQGHNVVLHGRSRAKLEEANKVLASLSGGRESDIFVADLSVLASVAEFANAVISQYEKIDVLINNAGVYKSADPITPDGLDVRFAVNAIAPYLLTKKLLPLIETSGRIINLSSAAQSPVNLEALKGRVNLSASSAYAQSKLALTMWSRHLALALGDRSIVVVAVNPGSMLGSKMVKQAYGVAGGDIRIGAEILTRAALSDEFKTSSGKYFDNDSGRFAPPHPDALDPQKSQEVVNIIEEILA